MRSRLRRSYVLGAFVVTIGSVAVGCGSEPPTSSGSASSSGSSSGKGGEGGVGGQGGASGGAGGLAGQGGAGGKGGAGGAGGGQTGGGGQGGGGGECNPGETMPCYSGAPNTNGVGECKGGVFECVDGKWGTTCKGEVLPSGAADVCDGKDEDCNGQIDDGFGPVSCGVGVCLVTVNSCQNGMPQTCKAGNPQPPKCDGFDEDCDGQIDEADEGCSCTEGAKQPCYSGGAGTDGVGVCKKGVQTCVAGSWGMCVGEVLPSMESCNGLDDDCNGQKDDNLGQTNCGTGQCAKTVNNCVNGFPQTCVPGTPQLEICNNLDDNCNGSVDDGLGTISCGVGACRVTTQACVNGAPGMCTPGNPTTELCDDIDNDCDGMVDDGNPGGGGACTTPLPGVCATGVQTCSFGTLVCAATVQPSPEVCNGLDDNCNGVVDDGNPGGGQSCPTGVPGLCATGTSTCSNGNITCTQTVFPAAEACDGLDNNCNGQADENNPGGGGVCTVAGQQGLCAQGAFSCTGGTLVCAQTVQPTSETCDNKDNDCDGTIDDGNPGGGQMCMAAGQTGECSKGSTTCSAGNIACTPGMPTAEICDGKDNNCNGTTDDGNPGGGMTCSTGLSGICGPGTTACSNGAIKCNSNQMPRAETCNGLDDNCNGSTDEGNPESGQACTANGQVGQCRQGTTTCSGGMLACTPSAPTTEICDGLDNNCNGSSDEGNPGGGGLCFANAQGECRNGTLSCTGGALVCNASAPNTEICDGKDNDCDGLIDEGNPGGGAACNTGIPGKCSAGTVTCVNSALTCVQNQQASQYETCGNAIDDNCNGQTDENADNDGDGYGICDNDCCDNPTQCNQPSTVNPGAFEVLNNSINDDCDATTSDTVAPAQCGPAPLVTPTSAMNLVNAMDICQTALVSPPTNAQKKWGVLSAVITSANGVAPAPTDLQRGVLANFGPNVLPRKGTTMAALSSGTARDATDPGFFAPQPQGYYGGGLGAPPPAYLAAHGGTLQTTPGCTTANDANDSANLKVQIRVPTNAQSFTYKFKFYSTEYPEWLCTLYNDFYLALLTSTVAGIPADKNISFDSMNNPVSVNNAFFDVCNGCSAGTNELVGTGVGGTGGILTDGGGTTWLTTTSPITPGETMTIEFMIWDTGDQVWDSTVLLDAFEWSTNSTIVGTSQ